MSTLQGLTMFDAHFAIELFCRRRRNKIEALCDKSVFEKNIVFTLGYDKAVVCDVFAENKPSFSVAVGASTDTETSTLSECIEVHTVVSTDHFTVLGDDVTVFHWDILREKLSEIAFTDKTNAGAILFLGYGNVEFERKFANFGFCQITERENDVTQLMRRYLIEEIGLILIIVLCTQ